MYPSSPAPASPIACQPVVLAAWSDLHVPARSLAWFLHSGSLRASVRHAGVAFEHNADAEVESAMKVETIVDATEGLRPV
jgi:hypothetical protein